MDRINRRKISGRASLAALAALSVLILAISLSMSHTASAAPAKDRTLSFTSIWLEDANTSFSSSCGVDMLLPNVTGASQGFRVRLVTQYSGNLEITIPPGPETHADVAAEIYSVNGQEYLSLYDQFSGKSKVKPIGSFYDFVTVRVLPAVDSGGTEVRPISAGVTVSQHFDYDSDGVLQPTRFSLAPMPY